MNQQLHGPGYAHQSIDDTPLSVLSTQSDIKPLRSALRQPFSSSKPSQSPRRVRFDFMGAEVLPTASPEATNFMAPSPVSPTLSAEHVSFGLILDDKQALPRMGALSRKPLDPGTVWTVVNPPAMPTKTHRISQKLGAVSEGLEDGDDDHSGEKSPINVKPSIYTTSAKSSSSSEEEDMFHFEAGGLSTPPRPQQKRLYVEEEEEEEEIGENLGNIPNIKLSLYATSLAVDITKPSPLSAITTPTTAKFQAGSLGSYKGQPVIMPVVRNPDVYARAASLGLFDTYVGGLGGESGMSESDLNSFRGGFFKMPLSGMPGSFTERLVMEEQREKQSEKQSEKQRVAMFSQVTACGP